jgi:voltage-gated potassium channel
VISALHRQLRDDVRGRVLVHIAGSVTLVGFVAALAGLDAERDAPNASISTLGDALWWAITTITTVGTGSGTPSRWRAGSSPGR